MSSWEKQVAYLTRVLELQFSEEFVRRMKARVFIGYHRYGHSKQYAENSPYNIMETIKKRLQMYEKNGNQEHLVDAANFIMIEYQYPQHPKAHFESIEEEDAGKRLGVIRDTETLLRMDDENHRDLKGNFK